MRTSNRPFSTQVELPCTVMRESHPAEKFSGTALRMEPKSMILRIPAKTRALPRVGEEVDLAVHLPVNLELGSAKDLKIHGLVVEVNDLEDGSHQFVLSFRRVQFADRNSGNPRKKTKGAAASNLRM